MDVEDYSNRAMLAIENSEWHIALIHLRKLLILDPDCENWKFLYIKSAIKDHKYSQAEDILELCDGNEKWFVQYKIKLLVKQGKLKKALRCCDEYMKGEIECNMEEIDLGMNSENFKLVRNLKDKIEYEMREYDLGMDDVIFKDFRKWVKNSGSQISLVKVKNFQDKFRGVCAGKYLESYSRIVFIPNSLILYSQKCWFALGIDEKVGFKSYHSVFALFLAVEKKNVNSFWKAYLDILPKEFYYFPLFFGQQEILMLKGSSMIKMCEIQRKEILEDFLLIEHTGLCTYEEFLKGRLIVSSRLHSIKAENDLSGLVPFADLFNHRSNSKTIWSFDFENQGFYMETSESTKRGEEICINYGSKSNIKLMLSYGFALENNEDDEFILFLHLKKSDPLKAIKKELIRNSYFFHLTMKTDSKYFQDLFGFLRLKFCQDAEFIKNHQEKFYNLKNVSFISVENENTVLEYLRQKCEKCLNEFDQQEFYVNELEGNIRNCWIVRQGEIRVLNWALKFCIEIKNAIETGEQGQFEISYKAYLDQLKLYINI